jgi:hypothetical protein
MPINLDPFEAINPPLPSTEKDFGAKALRSLGLEGHCIRDTNKLIRVPEFEQSTRNAISYSFG